MSFFLTFYSTFIIHNYIYFTITPPEYASGTNLLEMLLLTC